MRKNPISGTNNNLVWSIRIKEKKKNLLQRQQVLSQCRDVTVAVLRLCCP
jgi:hypothetical protein